jgi:glutamine kinase
MTKAQTLIHVKTLVKKFNVPSLIFYKVSNISKNYEFCIGEIVNFFPKKTKLAIRSSAFDEDGQNNSLAGEFRSILNIPSSNFEKITEAIDLVVSSYKSKRPLLEGDEIIFQEMIENSLMSGVIFTHELNTGAPYYVINYDDQSRLTDTVTSGTAEYANRTMYVHRNSIDMLNSERFKKLLQAVQELEDALKNQFLDIEFALGEDLTPYLLQVRTITTQPNWNRIITKRIDSTLKGAQKFVIERLKKFEGVYGETTLLGQMPDWNPAEIIGRAPRALVNSLYQKLITDQAWSIARDIMGYTVPTGQPLMVTLAGQPFIDTRLSFHSYLPKKITPTIAEKVVNHWISHLKKSPELHDKVEFDIAITTFSFDMDDKVDLLIGDALTEIEKEEFKHAHLRHTRDLILETRAGSLSEALNKIEILNDLQKKQKIYSLSSNVHSLFKLISDTIQNGTIPFSILARHGFIAKTILQSLYNIYIITKDEYNQFLSSIQTVASDLVDDMTALHLGELNHAEFMSRYGHLRPRTYDITSKRYDQMSDFSSGSLLSKHKKKIDSFRFSKIQINKINELLEKNNFNEFKADDLLNYIREATIAREYAKFVFTRSVSDMLEIIANFSEKNGLTREEISHVPINSILEIVKSSGEKSIEEQLRNISILENEKHQVSLSIRLPQLLTDQQGIHIVPFQVSHPNFITQKKVTALCIILQSDIDKHSLEDKIVVIESADPGFDWIFSQKIAGLITKYGGTNSHMAIRCAEFNIPAAIGCGEQRFESIIKSSKVRLDCAAQLIDIFY